MTSQSWGQLGMGLFCILGTVLIALFVLGVETNQEFAENVLAHARKKAGIITLTMMGIMGALLLMGFLKGKK